LVRIVLGKIFSLRDFAKQIFSWVGRNLSIKSIIHDFEDAIINALKIAFDAKYHSCCYGFILSRFCEE
jgi:hypothetical protein